MNGKRLKCSFRQWGIEKQWPNYRAPPMQCNSEVIIPTPETVYIFFDYEYSDDPYENKLYPNLFYIGFLVGMRPSSELANMNLENIHISDGRGAITIIEEKKYGKRRIINPWDIHLFLSDKEEPHQLDKQVETDSWDRQFRQCTFPDVTR